LYSISLATKIRSNFTVRFRCVVKKQKEERKQIS
jgi:hypothetical protein